MITYFEKRHNSLSYRILSAVIAFTFIFSLVLPPGYAQLIPQALLNLPAPGAMVPLTNGFTPTLMTGITIHPDNPLRFDFIMDRGQSGLAGEPLKEEYRKMIKYFMASLTVPEDELWVNLSPYEKDRMVPQGLGDTEMGRDMLAQDYLLKQLTASLMYPEKELGKEFWNKVYKEAQEKFGTTEIPVNTFNKVWIVPDEALVYEQGTSAFVIKSRLAVMLEEDYEAMQHEQNVGVPLVGTRDRAGTSPAPTGNNLSIPTQIIREVIIPAIEQEINEGKNFANLRQIYNALILATWYKQRLKDSLLGKVYVDQNKTKGIDTQDKGINQKIYGQYIESFKKGVYNFIKEDYDPATQQVIPRKYFSGGARLTNHPKKGSLILNTVGPLLLGALLAFGSPAPANAQDLVAAATGGNKDGVTTEFVDNAQQGDVGTAIVVKEGAVQPVLLTGMWGKWAEERRLMQEEQRKFYEEMGGDWGEWQAEQYRKTYERLMVLSTAAIIYVIKQEGYPTLGVGADILAERKDRSTVKPLIELYRKYLPTEAWQKEGPFYARADLVSAIGRIGGDEAKRFLQETVKNDPSPTVRDVARQKLLSLSTKSIAGEVDWGQRQEERYQKTYERLSVLLTAEIINVISREGYPTLGVGADILAERKDRSTVKPLIELYRKYLPTEAWQKEGPFYARADLVSAIGRIGGDEAKRFLQETVRNDPSHTVRDVAKQQLLRLSSEPASSPIAVFDGKTITVRDREAYEEMVNSLGKYFKILLDFNQGGVGDGREWKWTEDPITVAREELDGLKSEGKAKDSPESFVTLVEELNGWLSRIEVVADAKHPTIGQLFTAAVKDSTAVAALRILESIINSRREDTGLKKVEINEMTLFQDVVVNPRMKEEVVKEFVEVYGIDLSKNKDPFEKITTVGDAVALASSPVVGEIKELSPSNTLGEIDLVVGLIRLASEKRKFEGAPDAVALAGTLKYEGKNTGFEDINDPRRLSFWSLWMRFDAGYLVSFNGEPILKQELPRGGSAQQPEIFEVNGKPPVHLAPGTIYLEIPGDKEHILKMKNAAEVRGGWRVSRISREQFEMAKAFSIPRDLGNVGRLAEEINRLARGFGINGDVVQEKDGSLSIVDPQGFFNRSVSRTLAFHLGIWKKDSRNPAVQKAAADLLGEMGIETSGVKAQGEQGGPVSSPVSFKGISPKAGEKLFDIMPLTEEERSNIEVVTIETGRGVLHERQAFVVLFGGRQLKVYLTPETVKALEGAVRAGNSLEKTIGEGFDRLDDEPTDIEDVLGEVRMAGEGVDVSSSPMTGDTFRKGGIDLNPALLDLQIRRDGNGVPLPLPMQPIENMHIEGFLPIIINVTPMTNLPMLLGLAYAAAETQAITAMPDLKTREVEPVSLLN